VIGGNALTDGPATDARQAQVMTRVKAGGFADTHD